MKFVDFQRTLDMHNDAYDANTASSMLRVGIHGDKP